MEKIRNTNWPKVEDQLNIKGYALLKSIVNPQECQQLIETYNQEQLFRKTINMARYRFGSGEYKYYQYPLPELISDLREGLYQNLFPIANRWMRALQTRISYPDEHSEFITSCHEANQLRPTPLILRYHSGDYNTLHQDLYGEIYFPLQAILFLNSSGKDYDGGELVLTEQVPRAQSKAMVIRPELGDIVIIPTQFRPEKGNRGYYRKNLRHGVSEVTSGIRHTLGIIFHDAA